MAKPKKKGKAKAPAGLSPIAALGPTLRRLMDQVEAGEVDAEAMRHRLDSSLRGIAPEKALPILLGTAVKAGPQAMARLEAVMPGRLVEAGEAETLAELLGGGRLDPDAIDLGRRWLEGSGVDLAAIPDGAALRAPRVVHARILDDEFGSQGAIFIAWHPPGEMRRLHVSTFLLDFNPPWEGAIKDVDVRLDHAPRYWGELEERWSRDWGSALRRVDAAEVKAAVLEALEANRAEGLRLPIDLIRVREAFLELMRALPDPEGQPGFSAEDFDALASLGRRPEQLGAYERRYGRRIRTPSGQEARVIDLSDYDEADDDADLGDEWLLEPEGKLIPAPVGPEQAEILRRSLEAREILESLRADPSRVATPEEIDSVREARREASSGLTEAHALAMLELFDKDRPDLQRLVLLHGEHLEYVREHRPGRMGEFLGEDLLAYRRYRANFARFGDRRELLDAEDFDEQSMHYFEHDLPDVLQKVEALWSSREDPSDQESKGLRGLLDRAKATFGSQETERDRLRELLMMDHWLVQDILPLAPPPEPLDWSAPAPGHYREPVARLLEIGPELDPDSYETFSRERSWREDEARRDLVRMATDPGLLGGWPARPESWAPYHAMSMLGRIDAHDLVEELRPIIDPTDWEDWYGDHLLAECLGRMGPEVEPFTWSLIHDPELDAELRGLALLGLRRRAERRPKQAARIARSIADFLQAGGAADPDRRKVNAYAAHVLHQDCFPKELAESAIREAAEAGLIDHHEFDAHEIL